MMDEAWEGIDDGDLLSKLSVNAMIGLMAIDQSKLYKHSCSTSSDDMPEEATLLGCVGGGEQTLYDFITVTRMLGNCHTGRSTIFA